jgi:hypothetical protein
MAESIDVTAQLARWSQMIASIAQTGLTFSNSPYDVERYEQLLELSADMMATINARACLDPALAAQLERGWRSQIEAGPKGYVAPKVTVGAIVFNTRDELLLVHSAIRHNWCFPAGMADVGYTAAEVARKEVLEETGLRVTPLHLMGVADSFRRGFDLNTHSDDLPQPLADDGEPWVKRAYDWRLGINRQPNLL